jgi:hypothetical protein
MVPSRILHRRIMEVSLLFRFRYLRAALRRAHVFTINSSTSGLEGYAQGGERYSSPSPASVGAL